MSDDLVLKLKQNDKHAFETFVSLYDKKIYNYAYGFCLNHDDALDITQEVFLKIYRNIGKFQEKSSLSTWVYKITSNVCIDYARKKKPTVAITDENIDIVYNIKDKEASTEDQILNNELSKELSVALNELDYDAKQIIIMRDVSGLSYDEIAGLLGLEQGTVKSRISRSRKKLRDIIVRKGNFFENVSSNK